MTQQQLQAEAVQKKKVSAFEYAIMQIADPTSPIPRKKSISNALTI